MSMQTLAIFAGVVILWFALGFVTKTWTKQWIAAVLAGASTAWWRYAPMQEVAAGQGLQPMSPVVFGLYAIGGMLVLASAGMGLHLLLRAMRKPG